MWDLIFPRCLLDKSSRHSEPHFQVMEPLLGLWSARVHLPPAPFHNALKPSSLTIFLKQSMTPLYDVWPARAATWSLVLMTSAGVTSEAAGTPWEMFHNRHNEALTFYAQMGDTSWHPNCSIMRGLKRVLCCVIWRKHVQALCICCRGIVRVNRWEKIQNAFLGAENVAHLWINLGCPQTLSFPDVFTCNSSSSEQL